MTDNFARDVVEITQMIARLAGSADRAENLDEYAALWSPDAEVQFTANPAVGMEAATLRGHDEIRAATQSRRAARIQGTGSRSLHIVSNVVAHPRHGDFASATASSRYYRTNEGTPVLLGIGSYDDSFRRDDGRWLLQHRRFAVF